MAKKKLKKFLKKAAKAALIGGALYAGAKGLKGLGKKRKSVEDTAAMEGITKPFKHDLEKYKPKFVHPPYKASEDKSTYFKKGGRTRKQFGGGLNRPVARPVGGVARPIGGVDAPVRPLAYKHGGKVKSMGVAKRGGGIAKR
jgi:hypothetical protein